MIMKDQQPPQPNLIRTPMDALGPSIQETIILDGQSFQITRPTDSDLLLNHPSVHDAFQKDEYMPYWADLWPGARMLGKALLRGTWPKGSTALEIGCGLGLAGVVALSVGLKVIFSDYDATALDFASNNARANGYHEFECLQLDWRFPPQELKVPIILASDVIYEERNVLPVIELIKHLLLPDGICLLSDQDRLPAEYFREMLQQHNLQFTSELMRAGEPGGIRVKGTVYQIRLRHG